MLISLGLNNTSNRGNRNLPTFHTLYESRDNSGVDAILDISNDALNDVHHENVPSFSNSHVTKNNSFICKISNLNPCAKIFVSEMGHTVPSSVGQVVLESSETFNDNEFVTKNDYYDIQLFHKDIQMYNNKAETGVNFSVHSFDLISCFLYFCYFFSICIYAYMYTPTEAIENRYFVCTNDNPQLDIDNIDDNSSNKDGDSPDFLLNKLRLSNLDRLIIGHLNINSIRYKFESLKQIVNNNLDILIVSESKLDHTFPDRQFSMEGYRTIREDREYNGHFGGGIIIFIRQDIPCKELKFQTDREIEGIFLEINLRKIKWLILTGYNPKKENISYFLKYMSQGLDKHLCNYDNILLVGDFNCEMWEKDMSEFCDLYNLKCLIKEPTCFKSRNNPTCIDLMLTNQEKYFQNSLTIESGLSDFHKMIVTVFKATFKKRAPTLIKYRNYSQFNDDFFRSNLASALLLNLDLRSISYEEFYNIFMYVLNKHAPLKTKVIRANNIPYMNKNLRKEVMTRSRLKNNFNKDPSVENGNAYKKQRNLCVNLFRKAKREYYATLNPSVVADNKKFWTAIKPLFSDKVKLKNTITLIEGEHIFSDDNDVAEKLNKFFINAVTNLNIKGFETTEFIYNKESSTINNIKDKFKNHPSILKIKENINILPNDKFSFDTDNVDFEHKIINLKEKSFSPYDIPVKILKQSCDIVLPYLTEIYKSSTKIDGFPNPLKEAIITPVHKKGEKSLKDNYRPVSILPTISKIFENDMYEQIYSYFKKYFSPFLCGFRKGYNTQDCLTILIESWKAAIDNNNNAGAVLTDLSKAFDSLNHELLLAKLDAYGFDEPSLNFIHSYLSNRKQRTKVNNTFSTWAPVESGVPQGSILGPLLFNIYMNDIFWFTPDISIANYADDTTPYTTNSDIQTLLAILQRNTEILMEWFNENYMKSNNDKCHLLISSPNEVSIKVGNDEIINDKSVKLLGVIIDQNLNFNEHVTKLCKKASMKFHALARVSKYMSMSKLRIIMKAFIESQFGYCPLVWMFHNRTLNNRINKIHERALRLVYKDNKSTFSELLSKDNSFSIHHRNLQKLAIEMYKVKHNISPEIMNNIFVRKENAYHLRSNPVWKIRAVKSVHNGTESLSFRGPKTWDMLPDDIKKSESLREFVLKVKKWKPEGCTCRLCKTYITNLGFL